MNKSLMNNVRLNAKKIGKDFICGLTNQEKMKGR
jgi:hypothetical protein